MSDTNGLPSVGARRKGPGKTLPKLPLSAFSPPNSGTSESFPLPPDPSNNHPAAVIDTSLSAAEVLQGWTPEVGRVTSRSVNGVVIALSGDSETNAIERIQEAHKDLKILSVIKAVDLEQGAPTEIASLGDGVRVTLAVSLSKSSPKLVEGIRWALENGHIVDLELDTGLDAIEELLNGVFAPVGEEGAPFKPSAGGAIILSNYLPPPHDLNISIVKLMNHPSYHAFQASSAALSLFPSVYVRYTPPRWEAPTPPTPRISTTDTTEESKEKKEWKRRIKMFLGPIIEAFGFGRIMYGSSSSTGSSSGASSDWYDIARESLAELGVDQEDVDAVFEGTAKKVYGA